MDLDPNTDLSFTRILGVPRRLVWECWTQPQHIKQFFIPKPHKVTACDIDLRVGGRFDTTFDVDGNVMENRGVYLEIIPQEKLVFTDAYTEGWKPATDPFMTALLILTDAGEGKTSYTAVARHRSEAACESHKEMGFFEGWGTVVDQLEHYAAGLAAP